MALLSELGSHSDLLLGMESRFKYKQVSGITMHLKLPGNLI